MPERYLLVRSDSKLRRLLKIQISAKKGEVFLSPTRTGGVIELFEGSEVVETPVGENSKKDITFTDFLKDGVTTFRGNFHVGYRASGVSVLKIGILTHAFLVPGLKDMQGVIELEQYYPARPSLYPETDRVRQNDILLPDNLQLSPGNLIPDRFLDKNIEEIFGKKPFTISFVAIPKHIKRFNRRFSNEDAPIETAGAFMSTPHFTLGILLSQTAVESQQEWLDHARHMNGRTTVLRITDMIQHMQFDFRVVRYYLPDVAE